MGLHRSATNEAAVRPGITVESDTNEILFVRYRDTGDETAFARLYNSLGQRLFAVGVRFFRNRYAAPDVRAMASDAAHETWTSVIEKKHQWSGSPGSLGPWIMSIHYYCLLAMLDRRSARDPALRLSGGDPSASVGHVVSPERRILAREALEHLSNELSPEETELLAVYYLTGDRRLLAPALGISDVALRKRVERIKGSLKSDPRFSDLFADFATRR